MKCSVDRCEKEAVISNLAVEGDLSRVDQGYTKRLLFDVGMCQEHYERLTEKTERMEQEGS
jgi:hypothetical protein